MALDPKTLASLEPVPDPAPEMGTPEYQAWLERQAARQRRYQEHRAAVTETERWANLDRLSLQLAQALARVQEAASALVPAAQALVETAAAWEAAKARQAAQEPVPALVDPVVQSAQLGSPVEHSVSYPPVEEVDLGLPEPAPAVLVRPTA